MTFAIDAQDEWVFVKATHHDGDAPIFGQVCGGFIATACEIEVSNLVVVETSEGVHAFGREVDAAFFGCCSGEVDVLLVYEFDEFVVEGVVEFGHERCSSMVGLYWDMKER